MDSNNPFFQHSNEKKLKFIYIFMFVSIIVCCSSKSKKNPETVSEHIKFNYQFKELEILTTWKVPAPNEHLEYRLLSPNEKIKYFFKTIFFDFVKQKK